MKPNEFRLLRFLHGVLVWACTIGGYSIISASVYLNPNNRAELNLKLIYVLIALVDFACIFLLWRTFAIEYSIHECLGHDDMFMENADPLYKIGRDFYSNRDLDDPLFFRLSWSLIGFLYFVIVTTLGSFLPKWTVILTLIIPEVFAVAVISSFLAIILIMRLRRRGQDDTIICVRPGLFVAASMAHKYYKTSKKSTAP